MLGLFDDLAASGRTVTHEDEVARHAKRIIRMTDGRIVSDERQARVDEPPPRAPAKPSQVEVGDPVDITGTESDGRLQADDVTLR